MKTLLRIFAFFFGLIAIIAAIYVFYSRFLIDYSLENLETALSIAEMSGEKSSLQKHAASYLLEDMALESAAREGSDLETLAYLETATRSMQDSIGPDQSQRASGYLQAIYDEKMKRRHPFLRLMDRLFRNIQSGIEMMQGLGIYIKNRLISAKEPMITSIEYSGILLLEDARESEKRGDWASALEYYQDYLDKYSYRPDRGMVLIAQSQVYKKMGKFSEAYAILKDVRMQYRGRDESEMAKALLQQTAAAEKRSREVERLGRLLSQPGKLDEGQTFKLALTALSAHDMGYAQSLLSELKQSSHPEISQRATFYLAWILKQQARYQQSYEVLRSLLDDESLEKEFVMALKTQLADIYYEQNEITQALGEYQGILGYEARQGGEKEGLENAWTSLAEIESTNLSRYQSGNDVSILPPGNRSDTASAFMGSGLRSGVMTAEMAIPESESERIRNLGIRALSTRNVQKAHELLKAALAQDPNDAWALSAMATLNVLFENLEEALPQAEKAYSLKEDEYTSAVLAYVYSFLGRYQEAAEKYRKSEELHPDYFPANFNLGIMYLKLNQYQLALKQYSFLYTKTKRADALIKVKIMNNLGFALWKLGSRDQAVERFRQAARVMPNYPIASYNLKIAGSQISPKMVEQTV